MERVEFLEGVNRKEDKAWDELYQYFYAPLCCYSARITRNENAAEDIVQGCLVRLWHSSVCFREIKVITSYLYRSVYNASLNFVRSRQRAWKLHEEWMDRVLEDEEEGMAMALEEEAITRFYTVVSGLPEQQREILLLCMKGEKVKEIAAKLGISENTVKTQKKRAYHFLREQLSELWAIVLPLLFDY